MNQPKLMNKSLGTFSLVLIQLIPSYSLMRSIAMKKILTICLILCLAFSKSIHAEEIEETGDLAPHAASAYLMEYSTGQVLFEKNAEEKMYPASMTKMMGLILIFEALNSGKLNMEDMITVSETAASMGGSQIFLEVNEVMSAKDLIKSICIASANDAMVAVSEKIAGSVENFVKMMNEKGKELGLVNTNFVNTTGLHDPNHYSCAKDMAMIAKHLLEVGKEELLAITSTYDAYVREDSQKPFWLVNTNKLIKQVDGVDGLKTGFTSEALSCITLTAKRDNLRFISVVMKEPDSKTRNAESRQLLEYGFSMYDQNTLMSQGDIVDELKLELASPKIANVIIKEDLPIVFEKGKQPAITSQNVVLDKVNLPLLSGDKIGEYQIQLDNGQVLISDLTVDTNMEKCSFFDLYFILLNKVIL